MTLSEIFFRGFLSLYFFPKFVDIGITTRQALSRFCQTSDARSSGNPSPQASGNGSIMRLAPVPIRYAEFFPDRLDTLVQCAVESSLTTHASPQCLSGCAYLTLILCGLMHGRSRDEVLSANWEPLEWLRGSTDLHPEIDEVARGSFRTRRPPEIRGSGYVVKSLEAALWAFNKSDNFRDGALLAVNLGDDADTTGAVYGQIAGAVYGYEAIPEPWRESIAMKSTILEMTDRLASAAGIAI